MIRFFSGRKSLALLCSLVASTVLLMSSGAAAAPSNGQSYSQAKAVEVEVLPEAKLLGPTTAELGSATAMFDGTQNSYADSSAVFAKALRWIKVNPLHLHATMGDAPK